MSSDVLGTHSDIDVYVYDRSNHEAFLGHVKVSPNVSGHNARLEGWYKLEARVPEEDHVSGEIWLEFLFQKTDKKHYGPEDFQILKLIGKGTGLESTVSSRCIVSKAINRYLWTSLSGTKERHSTGLCNEGFVQKGHRAEERSRPYFGGAEYSGSNCYGRLSIHSWVEVLIPDAHGSLPCHRFYVWW